MHNLRLFLLFLLCSFLCLTKSFPLAQPSASTTASASAPIAKPANPTTPEEFFARARQLSDLEAAGIPFHLKATYVATGDTEFTGNGTYEEWWRSNDDWRKETTLGDQKEIAISNGGKPTLRSTSPYVPLRLRQATKATLIDIPLNTSAIPWKMQHQKLSGVDLTVLAAENNCGSPNSAAKCLAQYYFTTEGLLRIQRSGATGSLYNNFQRFQNLLIPHRVDVSTGSVLNLAVSINSLDVLRPDEKVLSDIASLPADMKSPAPHVVFASGLAATKLVHQVQPIYPPAAFQQRIQGTVIMKATIDESGNVREPQVISSPSPVLDSSALQAVRRWKYQPVVLGSTHVMVETTISVVYRLRP